MSQINLFLSITMTSLNTLVLALAIPGNILVILILVRFQRLTVTNIFLLNLSVSDMIIALTSIPFNIIIDNWTPVWIFGKVLCKLLGFIQGTGISLVAFTQVVISIDRFIIVFYPLRPRMKQRWALTVIIIVWLLSMSSNSPLIYISTLYNNTLCRESWSDKTNTLYSILMLFVQYFLPVCCMIVSYVMIVIKIWCKINPGIFSRQQLQLRARSKEKLLKTVITISLLYTLAQLPRHVMYLCSLSYTDKRLFWSNKRTLWLAVSCLSTSASCYNPIIYFCINPKYRKLVSIQKSSLRCHQKFSQRPNFENK
uniref:GCR097 n=1 Tax=Schmidtea mediterranea TaxID=79327 RepID=A0A193KUC0_SCHMD|nr:GCR097 [Schmidtea mediterranea]